MGRLRSIMVLSSEGPLGFWSAALHFLVYASRKVYVPFAGSFGFPSIPLVRKPSISFASNPSSIQNLFVVFSKVLASFCRYFGNAVHLDRTADRASSRQRPRVEPRWRSRSIEHRSDPAPYRKLCGPCRRLHAQKSLS